MRGACVSGYRAAAIALVLGFGTCNRLSAEQPTPPQPLVEPNPASVTIPKLDATSSDDYYYFHKSGVSYERAFSDLDECRIYSLETRVQAKIPKFLALNSDGLRSESTSDTLFEQRHWLGFAILFPLWEKGEENNVNAGLRRCLAYKGYDRYGTYHASWNLIAEGADTQKFARLALIASGPRPQVDAIGP